MTEVEPDLPCRAEAADGRPTLPPAKPPVRSEVAFKFGREPPLAEDFQPDPAFPGLLAPQKLEKIELDWRLVRERSVFQLFRAFV